MLAARLQSAKPFLRAGSIEGFAPEILKGKSPSMRGRALDAGRKQVCCRAGIAEGSVFFLEQNPNKAAAWATTLGIQTTQIRDYVSGLTAVLLRTDTRVTRVLFGMTREDGYARVCVGCGWCERE